MDKRNIVLIGFMGSGKTTVSKTLGKMLNRVIVSSDDMIVEKEKRSINDIFKDSGEPYFREVEKQVIREISEMEDVVVDCGGGVVLDKENMDALKHKGKIFYLHASPDFIYDCVKDQTHRPLLKVDDPLGKIKELLEKREPFYSLADVKIQSEHRRINEICDDIIERMSHD